MPLIEANGCDFHYEMVGQGRDMVFIHGEIHGLEYWEHQLAEFSTDHRCFAYNRRGHAKTGWTDYGFSLVNQTRDLEQLIERLDIDRPVIVAVAFGTTIAANYAIYHPDQVRGLVLGPGARCTMRCNISSAGRATVRRPQACWSEKGATR
jgi:pimeloyl-ACP methyl ester carboxylesterase